MALCRVYWLLTFQDFSFAAWSNPGLQFEAIIFFSGTTQMVVRFYRMHVPKSLMFGMQWFTMSSAGTQVDQSYWQSAIAGKASSTAKVRHAACPTLNQRAVDAPGLTGAPHPMPSVVCRVPCTQ